MDEEFGSFVVTDPDLVDEGIDVSGLRTETDVSPFLLGEVTPGIKYEGIGQSPTAIQDLVRYFRFGLPAIDTSQPATPTPPDTGGGGGGTSPGTGTITPPQPDSIGGFDPGVVPGDSGFIGLDPDMDVDPFKYPDYGTYEPPTTPVDTSIMVEDFTEPFVDEVGITRKKVSYPGDQSGTIKPLPKIGDYEDVTTVEGALSKVKPPGFPQDYSVTGALGVDPLEKDDVLSGADVANPKGFLAKMGLEEFDPAEAFVKTAFNLAVGKPVTLFIDILKDLLPPQDPRVGALRELYPDRTTAGTISSGLMTGYNPVSGGLLYTLSGGEKGEPPTYGLQETYDKRIESTRKSLQKRYPKLTKEDLDSIQAGNITDAIKAKTISPTMSKTYGKPTVSNLVQNLADFQAMKTKEKKRLDLFSGDVDERDQMLEDIVLQKKIDEGIEAADDDKGDDMLDIFDTTPASIFDSDTFDDATTSGELPIVMSPGVNYISRKNFPKIEFGGTVLEDEFDSTPSPPKDTGGGKDDKPAPSTPKDTGGGGPPSVMNPPKSDPKPTPDFYQDPITTGGGGNQGDPGGSSGGCCFIMLEARYGDGTMDKVVRRYRDENMTPRNRRGYYKVAEVLVPLMRKSKIFKWIVTKTFADPLVSYGKWYYGENKHGWIFAPIKSAWLKLFDVVGTDTVFIRENGEEV